MDTNGNVRTVTSLRVWLNLSDQKSMSIFSVQCMVLRQYIWLKSSNQKPVNLSLTIFQVGLLQWMELEDVSGFGMAYPRTNRDKLDWDIPLKRLNSEDDIKVRAVLSTLDYTAASPSKEHQTSFCCYAAPLPSLGNFTAAYQSRSSQCSALHAHR